MVQSTEQDVWSQRLSLHVGCVWPWLSAVFQDKSPPFGLFISPPSLPDLLAWCRCMDLPVLKPHSVLANALISKQAEIAQQELLVGMSDSGLDSSI
jgi:hypothetical protein